MLGTRNPDRGAKKSIRIRNDGLWEMIDKLMSLDKYKNTLNKVINDALDYGLPQLMKAEFGEEVALADEKENAGTKSPVDVVTQRCYTEVVRLLKEIIINVTINKTLLSSLFQAKAMELKGIRVYGDRFDSGIYKDTPECMAAYELRSLKAIRK